MAAMTLELAEQPTVAAMAAAVAAMATAPAAVAIAKGRCLGAAAESHHENDTVHALDLQRQK
jgi:hypothetical protein